MKKELLVSLVGVMFLIGCGSDSSSSNNENNYTLGDKMIKTVATANAAVMTYMDRDKFSFNKYADLNEYVQNLQNSVECSSGDVNITVVTQVNKCGTYKIVAHNCYINDERLLFDGNATVSMKNMNDEGCFRTDINYTSNVRVDRTILGKKTTIEYQKGFLITFTPDTNESMYQYNITGNGTVTADNNTYVFKDFNIYVDYDYFTFNKGIVENKEDNLSLKFTDFSSEAYLDPITHEVKNDSVFFFLYQGYFYMLYNDSNSTTYILDMNSNKISDEYNFNEVYSIEYSK